MNDKHLTDNMWRQFLTRAESHPDRPALTAGDRQYTFGELLDRADRIADHLSAGGLTARGPVGLMMPNSAEFVVAFLALRKLSASIALIPAEFGRSELRALIEHVRPSCFLTDATIPDALTNIIPSDNRHEIASAENPLHVLTCSDNDSETDDDSRPALIKFTSGSTGQPKAVALTAENMLAEADHIATSLHITPDDRILAPVALSHSYGFDLGLLTMLSTGAELFIHENFIPRRVLRDIHMHDITVFLGVPSMYAFFLETRLKQKPDLHGVRYLLSCTAPLNVDTVAKFHDAFGVPICQHYGSSETGAVATHLPDEIMNRPDSVGRPMHGVHVAIVDRDGNPVPPGRDGELVVSGAAVARGYLMGRPESADSLSDGTYRTGDIGTFDRDGFLYIKGRLDNVINVGGYKVSPEEVAAVLEHHPAVREAAAIGAPDPEGGEVVVAAVALSDDVNEEELMHYCRNQLAEYKVPRRIAVLDRLPRGNSGKIKLRIEDVT